MIYEVTIDADDGTRWTVEIKAHNKPSAVAQTEWWFNHGRFGQHSGARAYGLIRVKVEPINKWVYA